MTDILARLAATIEARKGADPESSHTARLLAKGPEKCAEKFGEEAVEAIIEAVRGDRPRLIGEAADVLYHLLVMLAARNVSLEAVLDELARREGVSGIAEKAARPTSAGPVSAGPVSAGAVSAGAVSPGPVFARVADGAEMAEALALRARVFVEEQGVTPEEEQDGLDADCRHYLARIAGRAVGTARVRFLGETAKIQRVAVLAETRGQGVGAALMRHMLADLAAEGRTREAVLDSQTHAVAFYERLGFAAEGAEFLDAGIPHRRMRRPH